MTHHARNRQTWRLVVGLLAGRRWKRDDRVAARLQDPAAFEDPLTTPFVVSDF